MTDYLTEQEQVELLKSWIKQYSLVILAGVLIAASAITGWRYWQDHQNRILSHASAIYDNLLTARAQGETAGVLTQSNKLIAEYPKTAYGQLAALMLARSAVLNNDYSLAEKELYQVIDHSPTKSIRQIARLRLARLFIAEKKPDAAITVLKKVNDKTFNGLIDEVRGDAYLAMNNTALARQAYQQALDELPNVDTVRPLLRMKFEQLNEKI